MCVCVTRGIPVAVDLLERLSVRCWAGPSVYVCVSYEECRVAVGLLERERERVCARVCVCVSVCASYEECCVVVSLLERVSVWCWAGPSVYVCVSYEECRVAVNLLESEYVVLGRSVCLCVCHMRNAQ